MFLFLVLFQPTEEDFQKIVRMIILKKQNKNKSPLSSPLWWGASQRSCLRRPKEEHRLWIGASWSPSSSCSCSSPAPLLTGIPADAWLGWRGGQRSPLVPLHQPMTDCSLFRPSFWWNNCDFASWIVYYFECNLEEEGSGTLISFSFGIWSTRGGNGLRIYFVNNNKRKKYGGFHSCADKLLPNVWTQRLMSEYTCLCASAC